MNVATNKRSRRSAAPGITVVVQSAAPHTLPSDAVWMSNGRLVSHTIVEPRFKRELLERMSALRSDPQALEDYYIKMGVLTEGERCPDVMGAKQQERAGGFTVPARSSRCSSGEEAVQ